MPNKCSEIGFWSPVKCPVFFSDVLQNVLYFFSDCWDRWYTVTYWLSEYWCSVVALTFSVIAYERSVFSTLFGRWQQWCSCLLSVLQQLVNDEPHVRWRNAVCCWIVLQKKHDEPVHIVNVAIRYDTQEEDDTYAAAFEEFCSEKVWKPSCNLSVYVDTVITGVPSVLK